MAENDEHILNAKYCCRQRKEINRSQAVSVIYKNARHVCEGDFIGCFIYFDTVNCETSMPSLRSYP